MTTVYLIGSLRNPEVPKIANQLRNQGFDVFDDWYSPGPEADDYWQKYEEAKGHTYLEALEGYAARHIYEFDKYHLDRCHMGVLVLPAGKSCHLESGYLIGCGKPVFFLMEELPTIENGKRYDVMNLFAFENGGGVYDNLEHLVEDMTLYDKR